MEYKYKVGDFVWIREDLVLYQQYGPDTHYQINRGEIDPKGSYLPIKSIEGREFNFENYKQLPYEMIDHKKTNHLNDISYEVY